MTSLNRSLRFAITSVLYLAVSVALSGGLALTASAQTNPIPPEYGLPQTAEGAGLPIGDVNPIKLVATAVNAVLAVLGIILVVLVIYAGFMWMTAAGDEQKITKAKALLGNAIIGLIIILTAYAIASFTISTIQRGTSPGGSGSDCTDPPPPGPCGQGQSWQCVGGTWICQ